MTIKINAKKDEGKEGSNSISPFLSYF